MHCYWVLQEPLPPAEWTPLQRQLIEKAAGDRSCGHAAKGLMGEGIGGNGLGRNGLGPNGLLRHGGLPAALALPPAAYPAPEHEQSWREIGNALAAIPPRVAGSNSYGTYRNILWGLIGACQEAGRDREAVCSCR